MDNEGSLEIPTELNLDGERLYSEHRQLNIFISPLSEWVCLLTRKKEDNSTSLPLLCPWFEVATSFSVISTCAKRSVHKVQN